jgi:hypothetical protein
MGGIIEMRASVWLAYADLLPIGATSSMAEPV